MPLEAHAASISLQTDRMYACVVCVCVVYVAHGMCTERTCI